MWTLSSGTREFAKPRTQAFLPPAPSQHAQRRKACAFGGAGRWAVRACEAKGSSSQLAALSPRAKGRPRVGSARELVQQSQGFWCCQGNAGRLSGPERRAGRGGRAVLSVRTTSVEHARCFEGNGAAETRVEGSLPLQTKDLESA